MKITKENQIGLCVPDFAENLIATHKKKYFVGTQDFANAERDITSVFSQEGNKNYLFKKTAMIVADRIKAERLLNEDFKFLNRIKEGKKLTYLIDGNSFYRWERVGNFIMCVYVCASPSPQGKWIEYKLWKFNLESGTISYPPNEYNDAFERIMIRFVRLLIFTELSELEVVTLAPDRSVGTRKDGKFVNETKQSIVIVDSTWNKMIFRTTGFAVSGHLRLQRHGQGRSDVKLIYIEEFEKSGYVRKAKAELVNESSATEQQ